MLHLLVGARLFPASPQTVISCLNRHSMVFVLRHSMVFVYSSQEDDGKENPDESYTNKYQKPCCLLLDYGYKLVCVHDKFRKPFRSYLGEDAVYNFINSMIEEDNYCSDLIKKYFNKELVMTKEGNEDFKNSSKCWICDIMLMVIVK